MSNNDNFNNLLTIRFLIEISVTDFIRNEKLIFLYPKTIINFRIF